MRTSIQAILADLDGVLVDACEWHYEALNEALKAMNFAPIEREEHLTTFNGLPTKKKLQLLVDMGRVDIRDVSAVEAIKQCYTVKTINELARPDPIKIEFLEFVTRGIGIPIACVTNSIRSTAEQMLERTGQLKYMSFVISNQDVKFPKPRAEGYIQAMVRLSVVPSRALIIEDSDKGIQAAEASCANIVRVQDATQVTKENIAKHLKRFQ